MADTGEADGPRVTDDKYVVFKRNEFWMTLGRLLSDASLQGEQFEMARATVEMVPLADAVVIRRQDLFAGPALAAYAACIAMVAKNTDNKRLMDVADYFHEQSIAADAEGWKFPD